MMFVRFWIVWVLVSLAAAIWLFAWAVRTGQFDDARRSAQLPLDDVTPRIAAPPHSGRLDLIVLVGLAAVGIALTSAVVIMALVRG